MEILKEWLTALVQEYGMRLGELLSDQTLWEGDIATNLLDAIFQQLSEIQRAVLQAASIYRTPAPVEALAALVGTSGATEVLQAVRALLKQPSSISNKPRPAVRRVSNVVG